MGRRRVARGSGVAKLEQRTGRETARLEHVTAQQGGETRAVDHEALTRRALRAPDGAREDQVAVVDGTPAHRVDDEAGGVLFERGDLGAGVAGTGSLAAGASA